MAGVHRRNNERRAEAALRRAGSGILKAMGNEDAAFEALRGLVRTLEYQERVEALASALVEEGIDAYFGWSETALGYLYGYREHAGHRFLTLGINSKGEVALICGALSANQASRAGIVDIRAWRDGEDPLKLFHDLAHQWDLRSGVIAVDEDMPALMLLKMQAVLPAALFKDGGQLLGSLRREKNKEELDLLKRAAKIADDAYESVKPRIKAGMTENQVQKLLFEEMEARGGNPNFAIVATGPGGAEPHHVNSSAEILAGDVLILDFGCDVEGYRSDITRTVAIGSASEKANQVYDLVYKAHMASRGAAKEGVEVGLVDGAGRKIIEAGGYGREFMHRTGHGIGLQAHEAPYIVPNGTDRLGEGDCFSVEPGIYLAGEFGVRIENIIAIVDGVGVSLNEEPTSTLEVVG